MSHAAVLSRAAVGLQAPLVTVEAHLSNGLPSFSVVGLPESSVRESRERVRSALLCSHFSWPDQRITVSLAPAELPKSGGRFDLPIALAILMASGQLPGDWQARGEFVGELALDGNLRHCRGLLAAVQAATGDNRPLIVPEIQASQLSLVPGSHVVGAPDLLTVCGLLKAEHLPRSQFSGQQTATAEAPGLSRVAGQRLAKRALQVAAAGGHHLLMVGPPGAGKTLLASCLPGLMGPPDEQTSLDLALVRDTLGLDAEHCRPFRSPHHSISAAGLIGGGAKALPGEVSLAHGGVLFLDELPEFHPQVLELLRQPLEQGEITITRSMGRNRYPARFQLLAAMNPCPCGQAGAGGGRCRCSATTIRRYQQRISGPLLDRIDLAIRLEREAAAALLQQSVTKAPTDKAEDNIQEARERQQARQQKPNAELSGDLLLSVCELETLVQQWFQSACDRLELTGRGIHKALRVARTLADLAGDERVGEPALLEALSYRSWQQSP